MGAIDPEGGAGRGIATSLRPGHGVDAACLNLAFDTA
jgi:hypothetical protein